MAFEDLHNAFIEKPVWLKLHVARKYLADSGSCHRPILGEKVVLHLARSRYIEGVPGSPGKSQKEDQEDEGTLHQLGGAPGSFICPWSFRPSFWLFPGLPGSPSTLKGSTFKARRVMLVTGWKASRSDGLIKS